MYGHDVGDHVLKELAVVASKLQPNDYFGRWGGEEFLIVCIGRDLKSSVTLANELRETIEIHDFQQVERVTASFGVAEMLQHDTATLAVKRADEALYTAKNNGRNIVICAEEVELIETGSPVV